MAEKLSKLFECEIVGGRVQVGGGVRADDFDWLISLMNNINL